MPAQKDDSETPRAAKPNKWVEATRKAEHYDGDYEGLDQRLEVALDALLYHPRNRRWYQRLYRKGAFQRVGKGLAGIFRWRKGPISDLDLHFCGISHLDAAWLWPVVDTKRRAIKTFYKAVEHCEEFPFLTFAETSPQFYAWVKEYDPGLWERVKAKVARGRIEITGGMWIEPDLDMPSGEALVRQRLYGQLFYLREFSKMPALASLEDVFGFPWSLPQIMVKSGAKYFWTTKTHWSDANGWPVAYYRWRGIDGSELFTYNFTFLFDAIANARRFRKEARYPRPGAEQTRIHSHLTNAEIEAKFSEDPTDFNHTMGVFYGLGDGGRGPTEVEVMLADAFVQAYGGQHVSQHEFFAAQEKKVGDRYLVWDDEMYLEFHRATKVTQVAVKHYNRRAECWLSAAEAAHAVVNLLPAAAGAGSGTGADSGKGATPDSSSRASPAPRVPLDKPAWFEAWRKVLFNQFHDILPGTSIPDVYYQAHREQRAAIRAAKALARRSLQVVARAPDEVVIFNPFNWTRSDYLSCPARRALYYVEDLPGLALRRVKLADIKVSPGILNTVRDRETPADPHVFANPVLRATLDWRDGALLSLVLRSKNKELLATSGEGSGTPTLRGGLRVFREQPRTRWKAWNFDKYYPTKKVPVRVVEPPRLERHPDGTRALVTFYQFLDSTATVRVFARPRDRVLHVHIHTDVRDPKILVKYFIPIALESEDVTCAIPYAAIDRKRVKRTEREKAKWEMNMQKWVDVSDQDAGLAILNDNRYGVSVTPKGVYVSLTRTPKYPGVSPLYGATRLLPPDARPKYTDLKPFDFRLGLFPHEGRWQDAHAWREAENFNQPLLVDPPVEGSPVPAPGRSKTPLSPDSATGSAAGSATTPGTRVALPEDQSFLHVEAGNIFVGALKPSEWCGDALETLADHPDWTWDARSFICRLVELEGHRTTTRLQFHEGLAIRGVEEVDLLERDWDPTLARALEVADHACALTFTPWEIKTLRVRLA